MKALIILAHGSRRQESNEEIINLTHAVRDKAKIEYDIFAHAYLEIAKPDLITAIDDLIKSGTTEITVLPYFLNSGNHVKKDIPAIIEKASNKYVACKFKTSAFIGMHEGMPELILEQARIINE